MNDLVIDSELAAFVVDDKHTNGAAAIVERVGQTGEQAALVKDWQALLDIAGLGHGDDAAIIANVKDTVLLEDWSNHVLDDDRWRWIADKGALLVKLLGEQVNTKVAVLASLSRCGNANDLARAALKDEQIANADVVAWDGNGVWHGRVAGRVRALSGVSWSRHGDFAVLDDYVFLNTLWTFGVVVVATVVARAFEWVQDSVSGAAYSVAERVVVSVLVVISHVKATFGTFFDVYFVEVHWITLGNTLGWILTWIGALVLPTTRSSVLLGEWGSAVTEVPLGDVDVGIEIDLSSWGVTGWVLAVVDTVLNVDLSVGVALVWLTIADEKCQSL